jgi:hypothetical protein
MKKRGLIFQPGLNSNIEWAQGPQVLQFNDFVRVYFSTRIREESFFYSDVAYFDFDLRLNFVTQTSKHKIIQRSELGTFDHDGIFPLNVFRDPESERIFGFTCGWKRKISVDIDMAIGLAESTDDGETFERKGGGPILAANMNEPFLIGDPFVSKVDGQYLMFYIRGDNWLEDKKGAHERQYSITSATSNDLLHWERSGTQIIPRRFDLEAQAMPSMLYLDGVYHLIYCYRNVFDFRENLENSYRIGHAFSKDLRNWTLSDFRVPLGQAGEWDSEMQCYPQIFQVGDSIYIIYNGNSFGRFGVGLVELSREELNSYAQF